MKKVLFLQVFLAIIVCVCFGLGLANFNKAYANDVPATTSVWEGCYGNFGVAPQDGCAKIEFDGRTAKGYSDDYLEIDLSVLLFQASEWDTDHYSKDIKMQYCFLNNNTYNLDAWNWGYDYNGIYILTRNWEGWLQVEINVKTDSGVANVRSLAYAEPYEEANKLSQIILKKEAQGYSLFIDGAEYCHEAFAGLTHGFLCDANGKTYFAYQSTTCNENGTDRTFLLKGIYDNANTYRISNWEGCYGNYGAYQTATGINVEFDGHATTPIDANAYIKVDLDVIKFQNCTFNDGGYDKQDIMMYALLNGANDPKWERSQNGLYMETRSFDGKLYMKIDAVLNSVMTAVFEMTTEVNATDLSEIVLIKELSGYSLYVNGVEYGHEALSGMAHGFMCDENGKTYFGYASYSDYGDGNGRTFVLNSITTKGTHNVVYKVDGEQYKTTTYGYGATIVAEANPTREGYTFSGWSELSQTMPDQDVEVVGTFTVNMHNLVYKVDGETFSTEQVAYGTALTLKDEPTKDGYTFSGWSELPQTMPDQDVEVVGTFTEIIPESSDEGTSLSCFSSTTSGIALLLSTLAVCFVVLRKRK